MNTSTKQKSWRADTGRKAKILCAYREREGSQADFCRSHGVAISTLQNWLRQGPSAPGFIEVKAPARAPEPEWALAVELPGVVTVRAAAGVDPRWFGEMVTVLRCGA